MKPRLGFVLVALFVSACSELSKPAEKPEAPQPSNGRFQMLPLPPGLSNYTSPRQPAVWLLDTRTGNLSVCWFNENGMTTHCAPPLTP